MRVRFEPALICIDEVQGFSDITGRGDIVMLESG